MSLTVHRIFNRTGAGPVASAFPVSDGSKIALPRSGDAERSARDNASSDDDHGVEPIEPPPAASPPTAKAAPTATAAPPTAKAAPAATAAPPASAKAAPLVAAKAVGQRPVASARASESSPVPEMLDLSVRATPKRGGYREKGRQAEKGVDKPKTPARRARRSEPIDDDEEETPKKSNRFKSVGSSTILASYSPPVRTELRRCFMLMMVVRDGVMLRRGAEHRRLNLGLI